MTELVQSQREWDAPAEVEPAEAPAAADVEVGPGRVLTEVREARGLSVPEVAAQLRLSVRQVEALEADDFDRLPGITFLRGFVRNYAKLLQIDPAPLLAACPSAQPEAPAIAAPSRDIEFGGINAPRQLLGPLDRVSARFLTKYVVAAVAVVIVVPSVVYLALRGDSHPAAENRPAEGTAVPLPLPPAEQPPAAPVAAAVPVTAAPPVSAAQAGAQTAEAPAAAAPVAPGAAVPPATVPAAGAPMPASAAAAPAAVASTAASMPTAAQARVKMMFKGQSWVEIRDKSGKVVFSKLNGAGTEQTVIGTPPLSLVVGNARMVAVTYNDKPVDLGPHTPVDVARLNLE